MADNKDALTVLRYYWDHYIEKYGYKPGVSFKGRERVVALELLEMRTVDEVQVLIDKYLQFDDDFFEGEGKPFSLLPRAINKMCRQDKEQRKMEFI